MKRRTFLHSSAATCALALVTPVSGEPRSSKIDPPQPAADFELDELSITDLQRHMASGKYSARSLVEKYVDRINDIDKHGPSAPFRPCAAKDVGNIHTSALRFERREGP